MSRIHSRFDELKAAGRKALIPYVTAGDPQPSVTVDALHAMVEAGADILELGVPFSDPMADGPVIQAACERALLHHVSLIDVLAMVAEFRQRDTQTPLVLMGYLNPIEVMGYDVFAERAGAAGVDAVLTVDMPPEESAPLNQALIEHDLDSIYLIGPTSSDERIRTITAGARGFVYYVALKGVTGAGHLDVEAVSNKLLQIRQLTDLPVGVGFGIKDGESAAQIGAVADAVVVGSVLVNRMGELAETPDAIAPSLAEVIADIRQALDRALDRGEES